MPVTPVTAYDLYWNGTLTKDFNGDIGSPEDKPPRWIKDEDGTVTLHNVAITRDPRQDVSDYFINGFNASDKNLNIEWAWDKSWGDPRQMGVVRSDVDTLKIEAKNFSLKASFESPDPARGEWNNKGLFADRGVGSIELSASETIYLETGHFPIFADPGTIKITDFTKLTAVATGLQEGSGYVVRNVAEGGSPSIIRIVGTPNSSIDLISQKSHSSKKLTAVVEDASKEGEGTLITGGSISIQRTAKEPHSIVLTAHSGDEGHIDIEGNNSVTIGSRDDDFAVQGFSKKDGFSTIDINKTSKGKVVINGRTTAESAAVNIHYAGEKSLQNGDVLAAKSHPGAEDRFSKFDSGEPGTKTGSMKLVFSGSGSGMNGNMTAEEGSSVSADFSGDDVFFKGDITVRKGERFVDGETSRVDVTAPGRNASLSGNVTIEDGGAFRADISGENAALGGNVSLTGGVLQMSVFRGLHPSMETSISKEAQPTSRSTTGESGQAASTTRAVHPMSRSTEEAPGPAKHPSPTRLLLQTFS